VNGKEKVKI
jgi:hypothetical protein